MRPKTSFPEARREAPLNAGPGRRAPVDLGPSCGEEARRTGSALQGGTCPGGPTVRLARSAMTLFPTDPILMHVKQVLLVRAMCTVAPMADTEDEVVRVAEMFRDVATVLAEADGT